VSHPLTHRSPTRPYYRLLVVLGRRHHHHHHALLLFIHMHGVNHPLLCKDSLIRSLEPKSPCPSFIANGPLAGINTLWIFTYRHCPLPCIQHLRIASQDRSISNHSGCQPLIEKRANFYCFLIRKCFCIHVPFHFTCSTLCITRPPVYIYNSRHQLARSTY
jgi:hypothetical protein